MRKLLTEEDIVNQATARENRHNTFTEAYQNQRKDLGKWSLFFLLMFALISCLPFIACLYGFVGTK